MEELVLTILKQGSMAFIGCKITRAMGQKEISEIIATSGWAIIGVAALDVILDVINWVNNTASNIEKFVDKVPLVGN